jgi:hydroxypyruvate reductase
MNVVRKHLSRSQAAGSPQWRPAAPTLALIVSDVTGDAPSDIASGPCAPDPSTYTDAVAVLARWNVTAPPAVADWLERGVRGDAPETPKAGDPLFGRVRNQVIATAHRSLLAAAEVFRKAGVAPVLLGDTITGEAQEVAKVYAALVREIIAHGAPFTPPVALISGGECTVTLPAGVNGRGGRCSEFLLSLAVELDGVPGVYALAADTDGIDGSESNAGAVLAPDSIRVAAGRGVAARTALDAHEAYGFFEVADGLVVTGPTRTNVNDYRVILIR